MKPRVFVMIVTLFLSITFLNCCGFSILTNGNPQPIETKTIDLKTFKISNGNLEEINSVFRKTSYKYDTSTNNITFELWNPKSLDSTGLLKNTFQKDINYYHNPKNDQKYNDRYPIINSTPDGWNIWDANREYVLNPETNNEIDTIIGGVFYDAYDGNTIGRINWSDSFSCWNRTTKRVFWTVPLQHQRLFIQQNRLYNMETLGHDLEKINLNDGTTEWGIDYKNEPGKKATFYEQCTKNNIWLSIKSQQSGNYNTTNIYKYDQNNESITVIQDLDNVDLFVSEGQLYFFDQNLKLFKVNEKSFEHEFYFDLSQYKKSKKVEPIRNYKTTQNGLLVIYTSNSTVLFNIKSKLLKEEKTKVGVVSNQAYIADEKYIYGIDNATLNKSWSIDKSEIGKDWKILLIDERGVLIKDEKYLYAFRP